jgi:decaprenylphospho-beta-D-ribofuranose 2-oxidase
MRAKRIRLAGWGRSPTADVEAFRPERLRDIKAILAEAPPGGVLCHGAGRSYGDAALNDGGGLILTRRLDRLLSFDPETGNLVRIFLPRGFAAPVSPGTAHVTMGGALANDVHGKNHESAGSFGDHVEWFDLVLPSGEERRVSPHSDPELFAATVGGIGLTGIVLRLGLRLARVPLAVQVREERVADLESFIAAFEAHRHVTPYSVAWIDGAAAGRSLGRGILELARPVDAPVRWSPETRTRRVPFDLPSAALNSLAVRLFNRAYYGRIPRQGRETVQPLPRFLYPLDAIGDWNRVYGRRGFRQFQCVIPQEGAAEGLKRLLEAISSRRAASPLGVLKTLGGEGRGYLSFPMRGYTLALDFPNRPGLPELLAELERITLDHGGRIYLAKDSCLSAAGVRRMYPKLADFRRVLHRLDPQGRMQSSMGRRLAIREAAA